MKKKLTIIILLTLVLSLFAEHNPFSELSENPTNENFLKMYNEEITKEDSSDLNLAYLLLISLNNKLDNLYEEVDDLKPRTKFQVANLYLEIGKNEKALKIYEKINNEFPKWSCPWRHKGEALENLNRYEDSEVALKKAIEMRVEHYDAYVYLARIQKKLSKYDVALKTLETGLTYKGKDIEDPEKEVASKDVSLLHLNLLKKNEKNEEYNKLLKSLKEKFPEDEKLKKCNLVK